MTNQELIDLRATTEGLRIEVMTLNENLTALNDNMDKLKVEVHALQGVLWHIARNGIYMK